jgi:hypothetical protein
MMLAVGLGRELLVLVWICRMKLRGVEVREEGERAEGVVYPARRCHL